MPYPPPQLPGVLACIPPDPWGSQNSSVDLAAVPGRLFPPHGPRLPDPWLPGKASRGGSRGFTGKPHHLFRFSWGGLWQLGVVKAELSCGRWHHLFSTLTKCPLWAGPGVHGYTRYGLPLCSLWSWAEGRMLGPYVLLLQETLKAVPSQPLCQFSVGNKYTHKQHARTYMQLLSYFHLLYHGCISMPKTSLTVTAVANSTV